MSDFRPAEHAQYKRHYTADVLEWAATHVLRDALALRELAVRVRSGEVPPPASACCKDEAGYALWHNFSPKREMPPSEDGC